MTENQEVEDSSKPQKRGKHFYRKEKPWDVPKEGEDRWKSVEIKEGDMKTPQLEESSFSTLFPKYREKYIKEVFGIVKKSQNEKGIKTTQDLIEGSMTVCTTKKCWDPYAIIKARDVIKLLARSAPYQAALKVLDDDVYCDIIKIRGLCTSKEKFVKRRNRLIGPKGNTIKALEMQTDSFILVQGSTVSVVGHYKKLKVVRRVIIDTMKNIHPVYHIKEMMIKKELESDEKLKNENWDRFLPNYKKKIRQLKDKKKSIRKEKKEYTPFPPEQQKRKEDILQETGEYFLTKEEKEMRKFDTKKSKSSSNIIASKQKADDKKKRYEAPAIEDELQRDERRKAMLGKRQPDDNGKSIEEMKKKFKIDSNKLKL